MYKLKASKRFRKKFAKLIATNKMLESKIDKALKQLIKDPSYSALKTHKVVLQNWGDVYSSWVTGDIRIIWRKIEKELVLILIDIGGHSGSKGVYK